MLIKNPDINELQSIIKNAYKNNQKIRIRGSGHSCSGISIPRKNEMLITTEKLNKYSFEKVGTINVECGIQIISLKQFLYNNGFNLPIYPYGIDLFDNSSPTIGGFICAGGISPDSKEYGGFWENVLEITLTDGYGEIKKYNKMMTYLNGYLVILDKLVLLFLLN